MLRSFRISNHRSFRDEHELLLMPAYDKTRPTVPVAAIYGANASGKSNLLDGLRFMADAVSDSYRVWSRGDGVPRHPFRLDPAATEESSTFVAELVLDSVRHVYGFVVDDRQVLEEWLYAYPRARRRVIFERDESGLSFGSTVSESKARRELLTELTRPNALFLSLASQVGLIELLPTYDWFAGKPAMVRFVSGSNDLKEVSSAVAAFVDGGPDRRRQLVDLLGAADLGITDLRVVRENPAWRAILSGIEQSLTESDAEDASPGPKAPPRRVNLGRTPSLDYGPIRLEFAHGADGTLLDLQDESAGTVAWLALIPSVVDALERGATLVVDELDRSLHPELAAQLILLFKDDRANQHHAQLVFTTHDTALLGTAFAEEILARDEIWFVDKGRDGSSELYALSEFHPRQGENTERRYIGGSYRAVPITSASQLARELARTEAANAS